MANEPIAENDPVSTQSLSLLLLVVSLLLVFSLVWAVYEEIYGLRPWKNYQQRFVKLYAQFLLKTKPKQAKSIPGQSLGNIRQRFQSHYGEQASLQSTEDDGLFTVTVILPTRGDNP